MGQPPLTIINYDILHDWIPHLRSAGIQTIVCDECQYLQNPRAIRTRAVRHVCSWVKRVMMLSGTPLSNKSAELYPVLNMLWPEQFPNFAAFASRYCKPRRTHWGWDYSRSDNLDELHAILGRLGMIRRRKVDVLKDLPAKVRRIVPCELSDPKQYEAAAGDFLGWLRTNMAHRVRAARRAEALTKVGYLLRLTARLKMRTPVEWANRFLQETGEKLVLFCVHAKAAELLKRRVEAPSVMVDGTMDANKRHLAVQQFQNDPNIKVFIGTRAAWHGINLTAAANIGMTELFWVPSQVVQAEDRIYRIGQTGVSWIHYFTAIGTIEERLCRILQEKQAVLSSVLDGGSTDEDLNVFDMLLDEIQDKGKLR